MSAPRIPRDRRPAGPEVTRCPTCGDVRFSWGPHGPPQRHCWACGQVWVPDDLGRHVHDDPVVRAAIERLAGRVVRFRRRP